MSWFEKESNANNGDDQSPLSDDLGLFDRLKRLYKHSRQHSHDWRVEARVCYDFVAGKQYTDEDSALLQTQNRPAIVFNRTLPLVDAVCGLEVNNRQEVTFYPRTMGDVQVNDILTNANKWARDECEASQEESDAFRDLITTGMGWTETRIDYEIEPEGKIVIERVDPLEMFWDSTARKKNLSDGRHLFRVRDVSVEQAEKMFPDKDPGDLHALWADDTGESMQPHDATEAPFYRNDQSGKVDKTADKVRLVEAQWWEQEQAWMMIDPITNAQKIISNDEYETLLDRTALMNLPEPVCIKRNTRKYYKAFLGAVVLKIVEGPEEGGFTYKVMTGKRDRNKGYWFGLVRQIIDPQRWSNRWLSQILHILNTNAKGGLLAEADAFDDPSEAADSWAASDSITLTTPGAIAGGKIKDKPITPMPQGFSDMMQFAITSVRDCSGLNMEILGQADRDQPGILEHQRKQAAMTILAEIFDSKRRYCKDQGRLMLYYIENFISDGRLIRINGQEQAKYVKLIHQPGVNQYDVIVDDAPDTVNIKERAWAAITQMMPVLRGMPIPPDMWIEILKASPMPTTFVQSIQQIMEKQKQEPPQPNPVMMKAQADNTRAQADMIEAQAKAQQLQASAQSEGARASWHLQQAQNSREDQLLQNKQTEMQSDKISSDIYLNYLKGQQIQHDSTMNQISTTVDAVHRLTDALMPEQATNQVAAV